MKKIQVTSRNQVFSNHVTTRIWEEEPAEDNPFLAKSIRLYGYDLFELLERRSFIDVFFLLFRGELPKTEQRTILERLMICLINLGPRHPATRAAMYAGVGKTNPTHLLPVSLSVLSGTYLGAGGVEKSLRFFRKMGKQDPVEAAKRIVDLVREPKEGDWELAPGFGTCFGGVDIIARKLAHTLASLSGAGNSLLWGNKFAQVLESSGAGWLMPGVVAAVLSDLGFHPRAGAGLFQIFAAPGLFAHGLEMANKELTALPFPPDEFYEIEEI